MRRLLEFYLSRCKENVLMSEECKICGEKVESLSAHLKIHGITIVDYGERYPDWVPFTTALKNFEINRNQLLEAILRRLVRLKDTPASNTETSTILVYTKDVSKNYKKIKQFPNRSPEEKRRLKILNAQKEAEMRQRLTFYCPSCKENVSPLHCLTLGSALRGEIKPEEAIERLKVAHYRHIHTKYESELFDLEEKVREYYFDELCPQYDYAWCQNMLEIFKDMINYTAQKADIKARCNEEAKRLIQEDLSQKMDEE